MGRPEQKEIKDALTRIYGDIQLLRDNLSTKIIAKRISPQIKDDELECFESIEQDLDIASVFIRGSLEALGDLKESGRK